MRPGTPGDHAFVVDSWRRSYEDAPWTRCPGGLPEYIATQRRVIETAMSTSEVLVACPDARPEQILGWVCYRRPSVVHYVYVKPFMRRRKVGTVLMERALAGQGSVLYVSHRPHRNHTWPGYEYNPALIFGGP